MLNAGTAQRRERLAGLLWPDASESSARANLRHALWRLRQAIGSDYILADRVSLTFDTRSEYWLDTAVLESQPLAGGSADELIEAVSAYAGELLPGFYEEWVTWERERLNAVYEDRVQVLLERLVAEERWRETCEWAERWIAGGQVPEPAYRALMLAHAGLGDRAGMAEAYQRCVEALEAELGVAPSQETVQLFQRLSTGDTTPRLPIEAGPPRRRTNLPTPPTPFVGREGLLAEIAACLQEPACRLLTLVGPGGCGKTRLALEVAAARLDAHEHGVFFVSLAPLEAVEEIVPAMARAVGFAFYGAAAGGEMVAPRQQLLDYLRNKSMLLVMDNYEHLLHPPQSPPRGGKRLPSPPPGQFVPRSEAQTGGTAGGAELVTDIIHTAPQIKILATSRATLNLPQEHRFPIPGLEFPDPDALARATDYSAVKLFLEGARRAQPHFAAGADNLQDVVRICRLVDGMPLGVLLAAGWVPILSPAEIATEIETSLDFLETDLRGVPERQRSVRAVFDHSWRLLTDQEQEVLAQLSVFRGGFTRRAVQVVAGATLRELKGLVDKSLLQHTPGARYELHELLRQYAAERLEADPDSAHAARDRHSAYYAGFLERRGEQLKGPRQLTALAEIEADAENVRAAWNWAAERGQAEWLDQGMEGLCMFYEWRGRFEQGDRTCQRAAERLVEIEAGDRTPSGHTTRVYARCLTWRGAFRAHLGQNEIAQLLLQQSISLLDGLALADQDLRSARAFALQRLGNSMFYLGNYEAAHDLFQQSLELCRELADRWSTAIALVGLGWAAWNLDSYVEMEKWHRESLAIRQALGDQRGIVESLSAIHDSLIPQGRPEEGENLAREAIAISRETGDRVNLAWVLNGLGWALRESGRNDEAQSVLEESVATWEDLGSPAPLAMAIFNLGIVQMNLGHYKDARAQLQRSLKLARETSYQLVFEGSLFSLGWLALVDEAYTDARRWFHESTSAAQSSGRRATMVHALSGLGCAELGLGNLRPARDHLYVGLETAIDLGFTEWFLHCVGAVALLLAYEGQKEQAVELYALVLRYPWAANSQWWEDVVGKRIAAVAATLPPEVVAVAQARGRARDLQATVRELLEKLEA